MEVATEMEIVCDRDNHRIQVFRNGRFSFTFGQYGKMPGYFDFPRDLTLNSNEDQFFITEYYNHRVQVFTSDGQLLKIFGNFAEIPFKFSHLVGIYCTPDNHMLINSFNDQCVLVFEEDGN